MIEVLVVLTVMTVAVSIFSGMVVATSRQRSTNREASIAAEAGRMTVETIRSVPFEEIWARYNEDPADDPGGAGTAPGPYFNVEGLVPAQGNPAVGKITFPALTPPLPEPQIAQLREDANLPTMGMPRDLNGDSLIDDADHAEDYLLIPVRVSIKWEGSLGKRDLQFDVMFTRWEFAEE